MLFAVEEPGFCLSALLSLAEPRGSIKSEDALRLPGSWLRELMWKQHWGSLFPSMPGPSLSIDRGILRDTPAVLHHICSLWSLLLPFSPSVKSKTCALTCQWTPLGPVSLVCPTFLVLPGPQHLLGAEARWNSCRGYFLHLKKIWNLTLFRYLLSFS